MGPWLSASGPTDSPFPASPRSLQIGFSPDRRPVGKVGEIWQPASSYTLQNWSDKQGGEETVRMAHGELGPWTLISPSGNTL